MRGSLSHEATGQEGSCQEGQYQKEGPLYSAQEGSGSAVPPTGRLSFYDPKENRVCVMVMAEIQYTLSLPQASEP